MVRTKSLSPDTLRVRVVDAEALSAKDRELLAVEALAGRWMAALYELVESANECYARLLQRSELGALGGWDRAFATAIDNDRNARVESVDVMRVTDDCRIFFFRSPDDPDLSGRVLDLAGLVASVPLSPKLAQIADLSRGAIVGIPCATLLVVFFVHGADLEQGAFSVAQNVLENYDEDDDEAVAPDVIWVHEGRFEPISFEVDDDGLPNNLDLPDGLS